MHKIYRVLLFAATLICGNLLTQAQGTQVTTFGSNPGNLNCYKFVPSNMPAHAPLVVVLHGCGQTALSYSTETAWDSLAQVHKFYVVYGEQNLVNNSSNCFNYWEAANCSRNQGEALSVKQMTDYMKGNYSIDSTRVFVTGLSAGGAMTAVMLSVYPDVFNAGAVMSGLPYDPLVALDSVEYAMLGDISHTPQQWGNIVRGQYPGYTGSYPRLSVFQGTADAVVNIENSHELVKQFTNLHSCDTIADYTNASFNGNNMIQLQQYFDSTNHVAVQFYQISNMAHGIAVYPGSCYQQGGAIDEFSFNESFYSSFWAAQFFGILHLPFSMNGYDTVTVNQHGLTYSVPAVNGATYSWIVPAGVSITAGQGTNSITVNWGSANGTISVSETLSGGCIEGPVQTFVTVVPAPATIDAALSNLTYPVNHVCADSVSPAFTLANPGQATLTSVTIYYQLDNGTLQSYAWSGSLATAQSVQLTLPAIAAAAGSHTLLIYSAAPNGGTDFNLTNDTLRISFTAAVPPVVNLGNDTAVCGGVVVLNAKNNGSHYLWSTGATAQSINILQSNVYSVTVTNTQNCTASDSIHVVFNTPPIVSVQLAPDTVCESGGLVTLAGGSPVGGTYSGYTVNNGSFNPAVAGYGNFMISYMYTDSNNCNASASENIYVVPCSTVIGVSGLTAPADTICGDTFTPSFTLTNFGQTSIYTATIYYRLDNDSLQHYPWVGNLAGGHSAVVDLPAMIAASGNHIISIFCNIDTATVSFTIVPFPVVNLGPDTPQCGGSITLNAQNNGARYLWSTGATVQSITVTQSGLYWVSVTNGGACSAVDSVLVHIYSLPLVTLSLPADTVCTNAGIINLSGGNPTGGTFSGPHITAGQFNAAVAGSGIFSISYAYTNSNGCSDSASENVIVEVCEGIENVNRAGSVIVFPNPNSTGWLQIKVSAEFIHQTLLIFDATGRELMQHLITAESEQLNISKLAKGVYLLRAGEEVRKLVVQ